MDRGRAGVVVIGSLLLSLAAAQAAGDYRWDTSVPGESVQYGVPQSDDRALRIDCRPGRGLVVIGPAEGEPDENRPIQITFRRGETSATLLGVTVFMGDGLNFAVPVAVDELPIAALLAGEPLTIVHGERSWQVPGEGAAAVVGPLVQACGAGRR